MDLNTSFDISLMASTIFGAIIIIMIDRSNLSDLYPNVSGRTDNMNNQTAITRPEPKKDTIVSFRLISIVAGSMTFSVGFFMVMLNYFASIINAGNIITFLPMIAIMLIAWVGTSAILLRGVANQLYKIGVSVIVFLFIYLLSLAPIAQLTFNLYRHINDGMVDILPFIMLLFVENTIFVALILALTVNNKMSSHAKRVYLVLLLIFCAIVTMFSNI
jgi:hypothetical protein